MVQVGIFLAGLLTVAQFSFWGNYLPRVYPTYLRGTGESFAANIGGRMIGTSAALLTTQLANTMPLALRRGHVWRCWFTRWDSCAASGCRSRSRRNCRSNGAAYLPPRRLKHASVFSLRTNSRPSESAG